uniref:Uncharacterized protein n=1 Tax=Ascaris lumbricoides TaxID=6252 RepID=A0A0M3I297_ASCLU
MFTSCILSESGYESPIGYFSPESFSNSETTIFAGPSFCQFHSSQTSTPIRRNACRSLCFDDGTHQRIRTKDIAVQTSVEVETAKAIARRLRRMADAFDEEFCSILAEVRPLFVLLVNTYLLEQYSCNQKIYYSFCNFISNEAMNSSKFTLR